MTTNARLNRIITVLILFCGMFLVASNVPVMSQINCVVGVEYIELNQASQTDPRTTQNGIPGVQLIGQRLTGIRLYVNTCGVGAFIGQFRILSASGNISGPFAKTKTFLSEINADNINRSNEDETINFSYMMPLMQSLSSVITVEATACKKTSNVITCPWTPHATVTTTVVAAKRPTVLGIPVNYTSLSQQVDPQERGIPDLAPLGYNVVAIDNAISPYRYGLGYRLGNSVTYKDLVKDASGDHRNRTNAHRMLLFFEKIRRDTLYDNGCNPDMMIAWFRPMALGNGILGTSPYSSEINVDVSAVISDEDRRTTVSHEIGHLLELEHGDGQEHIDNIGWDVKGDLNAEGAVGHVRTTDSFWEIMKQNVISKQYWISGRLWDKMIQELSSSRKSQFGTEVCNRASTYSFYVGRESITDTWKIGTFGVHESRNSAPISETSGNGEVILLDQSNNVIYSTKVDLGQNGDKGTLVEINQYNNIGSINLYWNGTLRNSRVRSAHWPTLAITGVSNGDSINAQRNIGIDSMDLDGDPIDISAIYCSDTNICNSIPLNETGSEISFDPIKVPAATGTGRISIRASDGINITTQNIINLSVGNNHPPSLDIISPNSGGLFVSGESIPLLASSYDLEDGIINDSDICWTSDINGFLGCGNGINAILSIGNHNIAVISHDSSLSTTQHTIVIDVQ